MSEKSSAFTDVLWQLIEITVRVTSEERDKDHKKSE